MDETLKLLRKIFPFRTCNLDIPEGKRVLSARASCTSSIAARARASRRSRRGYRETIGQIVDFLDGRQEPIAAQLRREMTPL